MLVCFVCLGLDSYFAAYRYTKCEKTAHQWNHICEMWEHTSRIMADRSKCGTHNKKTRVRIAQVITRTRWIFEDWCRRAICAICCVCLCAFVCVCNIQSKYSICGVHIVKYAHRFGSAVHLFNRCNVDEQCVRWGTVRVHIGNYIIERTVMGTHMGSRN